MGFILRRSELALHEVIPVPMDYAGADLQGALGYMFVRALRNEFRRRGLKRETAAVVTQVLVDQDDPGFRNPTKPIGSPMDEATAKKRAAELGWQVKEDPGRGWRRVVPSPRPKAIVDLEVIRQLVGEGYVVVACGGGGIPVMRDAKGDLRGLEAVIDKDTASSLLARELGADRLVVATATRRYGLGLCQSANASSITRRISTSSKSPTTTMLPFCGPQKSAWNARTSSSVVASIWLADSSNVST
jgi:carbamate kinase